MTIDIKNELLSKSEILNRSESNFFSKIDEAARKYSFTKNDIDGAVKAAQIFGVDQVVDFLDNGNNYYKDNTNIQNIILNEQRIKKGLNPIIDEEIKPGLKIPNVGNKSEFNPIESEHKLEAYKEGLIAFDVLAAGINYGYKKITEHDYEIDPSFDPYKYAEETGYQEYSDWLGRAVSRDHANDIIKQIDEFNKSQQYTEDNKWSYYAGAATGFANPLNYIFFATKGPLLYRTLMSAAGLAATSAVHDSFYAQYDPHRTNLDIAVSLGIAGVMGGATSGIFGKELTQNLGKLKSNDEVKLAVKNVVAGSQEQSTPAYMRKLIVEPVENIDKNPKYSQVEPDKLELSDYAPRKGNIIYRAYQKLTSWISTADSLMSSPVLASNKAFVNLAGTNLELNAAAKGLTPGRSMADQIRIYQGVGEMQAYKANNSLMKLFSQDAKNFDWEQVKLAGIGAEGVEAKYISAVQPLVDHVNFLETEARRVGQLAPENNHKLRWGTNYTPYRIAKEKLGEYANRIKNKYNEIIGRSKSPEFEKSIDSELNKVNNFEDFQKTFMTKDFNIVLGNKITRSVLDAAGDNLEIDFRQSLIDLISKNNQLLPEDLDKLAEMEIRDISSKYVKEFRMALKDVVKTFYEDAKNMDIDRILAEETRYHSGSFSKLALERTLESPLHRRMFSLDTKTYIDLIDESRIIESFLLYSKNMSNAIARVDKFGKEAATVAGLKKLLQKTFDEDVNTQMLGMSPEKAVELQETARTNFKDILDLVDMVHGNFNVPTDPKSPLVVGGRIYRMHNTVSSLGKSQTLMTTEVTDIAMAKMFDPIKGEVGDFIKKFAVAMDEETATYLASSVDYAKVRMMGAGIQADFSEAALSTLGKIEKGMTKFTGGFLRWAGIAPIDKVMRETVQGVATNEVVAIAAKFATTGEIGDASKRFISMLGISQKELEVIHQQVLKYGVRDSNGYLHLNLSKWDSKAYVMFAGVDKAVTNLVAKPSLWTMPKFMSTQTGKVIFQFASFGFAQSQQKILPRLQLMDRRPAYVLSVIMADLMAGAVVTAARIKLSGKDFEDYTPAQLLMMSIQYSNVAGIAFDMGMTGYNLFTGQDVGDVVRNVTPGLRTISNIQALYRALNGSGSYATYRKAASLAPLNNLIFLDYFTNQAAEYGAKHKSLDVTKLFD